MPASTLRDDVTVRSTALAWDQWAQLGVSSTTSRRDRTAADPEALVLFTLEIGRSDPRLFDETLDWLLTNERLISVQRLRNLCRDDEDRDLVDGALLWVARHQPRSRFALPRGRKTGGTEPRRLFYGVARSVREPDEAFLAVGLLKPATDPSKKSRPPDPSLPISFAVRMRLLFGVGSRAEVIRHLLTTPVTDASALDIAEAAGYAKRNINETLASLVAARVVTAFEHGNERRYHVNRTLWEQLLRLEPNGWPTYRDWPRLLGAVRELYRWLRDPALDELSTYMLASRARSLMERIEPDLARAGVPSTGAATLPGEGYWESFVERVEATLAVLESPAR